MLKGAGPAVRRRIALSGGPENESSPTADQTLGMPGTIRAFGKRRIRDGLSSLKR